jgi:hypothetical protein
MVPALLFAIDLATGSFTISGLQKGTDQLVKSGNKWNITWNPHTTKVMVFIKRGKLKTRECWYIYGQRLDNERIYLFRRKRKELWRMETKRK